ncbi:CPBP family intramembrane glutamic endopeptidase [Flammeovirga aprica]|uniref:CPBP family intramembrane glutamic endopeptidase n=1 Tax=Flammeovirga aprica TaxID=29528 RepID=UPI00198046CC|nr:CPBP family intramembrane glutamic endopeptidase [Flammeovirga aprica]
MAIAIIDDKTTQGLIDSIFRGVLFLVVGVLYKSMLTIHWKKFKQGGFASWGIIILGAILLQIVISFTKSLLPSVANTVTDNPDTITVSFSLFVISLGPIFTSLLEDIVFRYTLLHKFFIPNTSIRIVVLVSNSILFGLIHYYNFDQHLILTVSFMAAGLFLNLIYIWTRNIWYVLLIHGLNNFVLSTLGITALWFMQLLN